MKYKHFVVEPIEREPGKWRATIRRVDGNAITCGETEKDFFTTPANTLTPEEAVQLACGAIDGGFVS